ADGKRHAELVREIQAHNHRYYVLDDPNVSDLEFDVLLRELRAIEKDHPELVTPDSPTQRVGGEARTLVKKVKHAVRMFSLDNAYSSEEMTEFAKRVKDGLSDSVDPRFVVEPKLDGASLEVIFEGGRLVEASTRGDGEIGEEITANVRTIRGLPRTIDHQGKVTLRGEVVYFRKDLEALNAEREKEGLEPFANARNAAAGSVRMLDPHEVGRRPLRVIFYQVVEGPQLHESHSESLGWMKDQGLPTHGRGKICKWDEVWRAITEIDHARADYPFDTDGAVIKVDSYHSQEILGFTSKFPKWAIAYKFAAERAWTRLREIIVQVGRTGALTPVAVLDPVELAGTTVSRASLHNAGQVAALDVRLGDRVEVAKAGEIIPQVISVDPSARTGNEKPYAMPKTCPECGTPVISRLREEDKPELGTEATTRCPNRSCPAQIMGQLHYFARRFAMDIDSMGIALVEQLVKTGLVKDVADLYLLTTKQLTELERMGKKSAENVVQSIAGSRTRTLDRLLCGLGIPQIGQVAAKQLAEEAGTLETLVGWTEEEARAHVGSIRGFGPKMVDSVVAFLADPEQHRLLAKLLEEEVGAPQPKVVVISSGPLVGNSFCVTGILSRKREDFQADLRAQGAEIHDSVKKGTTYLVAGEKTGKAKLDQAKKFGTRVITEAEAVTLTSGGSLPPLPTPS
ncbi:MAG: NAD-dependent DNA ligase LigA, partial [Polyangiaceae bacterium]